MPQTENIRRLWVENNQGTEQICCPKTWGPGIYSFKTWRVQFFGPPPSLSLALSISSPLSSPPPLRSSLLAKNLNPPSLKIIHLGAIFLDKKIALYLHYFPLTAFGYFKFVAHRNGFALERPCACLELDLAVPMYRRRCGNVNVTRPNVFDCTSTSVRVASIACRRVCFAFFLF